MKIEVGKTYAYCGWVPGEQGRKALAVELRSEWDEETGWQLFLRRWPNGRQDIANSLDFEGPVAPAVPGVDEPCLVCRGTRMEQTTEPDPEKSWLRHIVGERPCYNCGHLKA